MGKITGVGTGWKGKVGNYVFQMWKGVQVVKTRVIPSNPNSSGQQASRGLLGDIVGIFKSIAVTWIRYFWNPFTEGRQSGWGNFIGVNLLSMASGFDIEDVVGSIGTLDGVANLEGTYDTATGETILTWDEGSPVSGSLTDLCNVFIFDSDSREIISSAFGSDTRDDEGTDLPSPTGYTATNLYAVVTFSDVDPTSAEINQCSDSQVISLTAPV